MSKFNIQTVNKIAKIGTQNMGDCFTLNDSFDNPDGILVRSGDLHNTAFGDKLLGIARAGAGVNNIPIDKCTEAGIAVFNTPGANANAVCEMVICALFMASRDVIGSIDWVRGLKGKGSEVPKLIEKGKNQFVGPELLGKSLGVVGLGAIGVMVANAAHRLGMNVYGYDPYISVDAAWGLFRDIKRADDLKTLYAECDYITLHLPSNADTKGMISATSLAEMRDGIRLINLARGELVNPADMLAALDSGKVARYVTDFPTDEMLGNPKVVPLPHLGASTPESEDNCAVMACNQLRDYIFYGNIKNSVNLPDVSLEPGEGGCRLCVIHKNIPNMVNTVTSTVAAMGVNIESMVNKSKKDIAYSLFDLSQVIDESVVEKLDQVEGLVRVRLIIDKN